MAATSARRPRRLGSRAALYTAGSRRMDSDDGENAGHERRVFRLALIGGLPAVIVSLVLLVRGDYSAKVQWSVGVIITGTWVIAAALLRERVVRPLQTLSNMLGALREGDYS